MIKDLPASLVNAARKVAEQSELLDTTGVVDEDVMSAMDIPNETEPEDELSGEKEEIIINPEYKRFDPRLRY
jgi:hypothetical protein